MSLGGKGCTYADGPAECAGALDVILKLLLNILDTPCSLPMAGGGGFNRSAHSAGPLGGSVGPWNGGSVEWREGLSSGSVDGLMEVPGTLLLSISMTSGHHFRCFLMIFKDLEAPWSDIGLQRRFLVKTGHAKYKKTHPFGSHLVEFLDNVFNIMLVGPADAFLTAPGIDFA